jgi:hypothetical protein
MTKQKKQTVKSAETDRFVVSEGFVKISLVEGIRLTDDMKKRAVDARRQGASPDEYRETIVRSHRKG